MYFSAIVPPFPAYHASVDRILQANMRDARRDASTSRFVTMADGAAIPKERDKQDVRSMGRRIARMKAAEGGHGVGGEAAAVGGHSHGRSSAGRGLAGLGRGVLPFYFDKF